MDIRATCDGVEGGRFGENARGPGDAHYGIDLLAEVGTPAWALESGRVYGVNRDKEESDFGKYVIIQSDGKLIMYAHLSKVSVRGGDDVTMRKTKIGETGVTGNACRSSCSCGPAHLHLGVKEGSTWGSGTPIDPEKGTLGTEFSSNGDPISDNCG
jgi:murein DD-endopeptidase MepM/ murein hydrolase activator NlpD